MYAVIPHKIAQHQPDTVAHRPYGYAHLPPNPNPQLATISCSFHHAQLCPYLTALYGTDSEALNFAYGKKPTLHIYNLLF